MTFMDVEARRKVTARVTYNGHTDASSSRLNVSRPPSPVKREVSPSPKPMMRPKAKVNTSATPNSLTRKPSKITGLVADAVTPRSRSPAGLRPSPRYNTPSNAAPKPLTARPNGRPKAPSVSSTPGSPPTPYSALSKTPSLPSSIPGSPHRRTSSTSLLHGPSLSIPQTSQGSPVFPSPSSDACTDAEVRDALRGDVGPKVKSKVTKLVKQVDSLSPSPPSRPLNARARAPSISSSVSLSSAYTSSNSPEQSFYPITTATAAANPFRYGSARVRNPPPPHHHYQPFGPRDDSHINYNPFTAPRVDPAKIPLPPNSPPTSAVSSSSRSSISRSSQPDSGESANGATTTNRSTLRSNLDSLLQFSTTEDDLSDDSGHPRDEEEMTRKVRAEAKTNRRIEDLEISNRSLLAINVTLESTKHRQAKEIRELKRKLRESRLILPPRAYRAVKSSTDPGDEETDEEEEDANGEEGNKEEVDVTKGDEAYLRVRALVEGLVRSGKQALEAHPSDLVEQKGGAKVLSAEEVRNWETPEGDISIRTDVTEDSRVEDEDGVESEDEVAEMALFGLQSASPSPTWNGPPILVTHS